MDLYDEFFAITGAFSDRGIRYAVVRALAMAFHDRPRFTRDIDLLVAAGQVGEAAEALKSLGYFPAAPPRSVAKGALTIHRFVKTEGEDHMQADLLVGSAARHGEIIERAVAAPGPRGPVRLTAKADIIWMKRARGSDQDRVDIERLGGEEDRARGT